jgi:hypothetical protein
VSRARGLGINCEQISELLSAWRGTDCVWFKSGCAEAIPGVGNGDFGTRGGTGGVGRDRGHWRLSTITGERSLRKIRRPEQVQTSRTARRYQGEILRIDEGKETRFHFDEIANGGVLARELRCEKLAVRRKVEVA